MGTPSVGEYLAMMRGGLTGFCHEASEFCQSQGTGPRPGSQAETEQKTCDRPESIVTAQSLALTLLESSSEHVMQFVKTVTDPVQTIACWTCVRSMLESSALAAWLLDPAINARTRIGRTFALRYEGLEQQLKFGRFAKVDPADLKKEEDRMADIEKIVLGLGYPAVTDKNGKRIGFVQKMPNATDMIGLMLDEEAAYRVLSAVAHGHHWAIIRLGFKQLLDEPDVNIGGVTAKAFDKTDNLVGFAYLGIRAARAFGIPLWNLCRYFGWDEPRLLAIFVRAFDKLQTTMAVRFWLPKAA